MNFGEAIEELKNGNKVSRNGWNGKGMFLFLERNAPSLAPFIVINTGSECRPWLASQADMLSEDWEQKEHNKTKLEKKREKNIPTKCSNSKPSSNIDYLDIEKLRVLKDILFVPGIKDTGTGENIEQEINETVNKLRESRVINKK